MKTARQTTRTSPHAPKVHGIETKASRRGMRGQSMTEFAIASVVVVIPLCPVMLRLLMALADFFNAQASMVSLPVP